MDKYNNNVALSSVRVHRKDHPYISHRIAPNERKIIEDEKKSREKNEARRTTGLGLLNVTTLS